MHVLCGSESQLDTVDEEDSQDAELADGELRAKRSSGHAQTRVETSDGDYDELPYEERVVPEELPPSNGLQGDTRPALAF